jgi:Mrp family chromosome partitioning ATPase
MSKIFEALGNAREHPGLRNVRGEVAASRPVAAAHAGFSIPAVLSRVGMEEEMVRLHQHLDALLPEDAHRVIQFIGSREGEGTSTVVREFASVSATRFDQRVLLLEMNRHAHAQGPSEVGPDGAPAGVAPSRVGGATFSIAALPHEFTAASHTTDAQGPAAAWARLRQAYDLVVIDSPPATTSPEGLAVCGQVDGVVLVVAAEETRWPVAQRAKESIERSGGRVLGIVFNKRQYYIPDFVYKRL